MAELTAGPIINRMRQTAGVDTDLALCAYFGYGTSTVSGWRQRNKIPYEECVILADRKGVSLDWLVRGIGTADGQPGTAAAAEVPVSDDRMQRLASFIAHWSATRTEDDKVWLEMQLVRAIPEYAEWASGRRKS